MQDRIGDAKARKGHPLFSGVMNYFPDALLEVAHTSKIGNDQHNPGQPLHWAREKSSDHLDCAARHMLDFKAIDTDGGRHGAKAVWRLLAELQLTIEAERATQSASHTSSTPEVPKAADPVELSPRAKAELVHKWLSDLAVCQEYRRILAQDRR